MLKKYEKIFQVKEEYMCPSGRSCPGCGGGILTRITSKAVGKNVLMSSGSCGTNSTGIFPVGPMTKYPVPISLLGGCGAALSGMEISAKIKGKEDATILGIVGDGDAVDIGFSSLSGMFERRHKVLVVIQDNQGYAATGGQRSGTTPWKVWTRNTPWGKARAPKYMPLIMLAHDAPYVATCSVAYPEDIFDKVQRATKKENQPAYIQCITPCSVNWKNESWMAVEVARQAVTCGIWPLWEYERGVFRRTVVSKEPTPLKEYIKLQRRYDHLTEEDVTELQEYIKELNEKIDRFAYAYSKDSKIEYKFLEKS